MFRGRRRGLGRGGLGSELRLGVWDEGWRGWMLVWVWMGRFGCGVRVVREGMEGMEGMESVRCWVRSRPVIVEVVRHLREVGEG